MIGLNLEPISFKTIKLLAIKKAEAYNNNNCQYTG